MEFPAVLRHNFDECFLFLATCMVTTHTRQRLYFEDQAQWHSEEKFCLWCVQAIKLLLLHRLQLHALLLIWQKYKFVVGAD